MTRSDSGRTLGAGRLHLGRAIAAAAFLALLSACPPPRIDFGPKGQLDDPEALLKLVAETEARVITLSGEAKVHADTPEAKGAFSMFAAVSRPQLIHLEALDFFGVPQAMLAVNGERFGLYDRQQHRFFRGPASPENVGRFLPIALPPKELVLIMLGSTPRIPHERAELAAEEKCACYVLTLHKGEVTQTLQIHPRSYRVLSSRVRGVDAYDLEFADVGEFGTVSLPRQIILRAEKAKVELDLRYADVTLNEAPDLTLFDLEPPEGAPVVEVDLQGRPQDGSDVPMPTGPTLQPDPT